MMTLSYVPNTALITLFMEAVYTVKSDEEIEKFVGDRRISFIFHRIWVLNLERNY